MTSRMISTMEKLEEVERLIEQDRELTGVRNDPLRAVASDLRARMNPAPSYALKHLSDRLDATFRSKTALGYEQGALVGAAQELIGRWPVVRQALELFGSLVESGKPPTEESFRLGFEHAVAGGEEASKRTGIPAHSLPLVMYFASEADRREMIEAVHLAKPGMVEMKIPERSR